jgi:hypothetical protein
MSGDRELLNKIIDWYEKDSSIGGLSILIEEIKEELENPEIQNIEPLIDEKINLISESIPDSLNWHIKLARAIEKAHGIGD